jgi:hypothetical protein
MAVSQTLTRAIVAMVCLAVALPAYSSPAGRAGGSAPVAPSPRIVIRDVALAADGNLHGQLLTPQGTAMHQARVALLNGKTEVAVTTTDREGRFALGVSRGGTYVVVAGDAWGVYRVWPARIAPPTSNQAILLVANSPIMRAQSSSPLYNFISDHPYLFYAGLAAAIAVPLAVVSGSSGGDGNANVPATTSNVSIMSQQALPPASP